MLDLIRYLLERNARAVTSRVACSACVSHRTATLRGIVDAAPDLTRSVTRSATDIPTSGENDGGHRLLRSPGMSNHAGATSNRQRPE